MEEGAMGFDDGVLHATARTMKQDNSDSKLDFHAIFRRRPQTLAPSKDRTLHIRNTLETEWGDHRSSPYRAL